MSCNLEAWNNVAFTTYAFCGIDGSSYLDLSIIGKEAARGAAQNCIEESFSLGATNPANSLKKHILPASFRISKQPYGNYSMYLSNNKITLFCSHDTYSESRRDITDSGSISHTLYGDSGFIIKRPLTVWSRVDFIGSEAKLVGISLGTKLYLHTIKITNTDIPYTNIGYIRLITTSSTTITKTNLATQQIIAKANNVRASGWELAMAGTGTSYEDYNFYTSSGRLHLVLMHMSSSGAAGALDINISENTTDWSDTVVQL